MSLRVWLPLNGNLDNKGLDNVTVINNGATVDNNGKIGKCYSFDGSDDYISLTGNCLYNIIKGGTNSFSISFWVYQADSTRAIIFGDYSLAGGIGFNIELTAGHAVRFYWNGSPDLNISQINVGTTIWNHVVLIYDTTHLYGYLNGNLVYTYTGTLTVKNKTSGSYYLGRDSRTGSTALNGRLNDFRIYDHALSPMEVKQISQGLILHYPLNRGGFGQENLYTGSHDFSGSWVNGSIWTTSSETYKGFTVKQKSSVWGGLAQNIPCSNGDIFTISFYAKVESGGRICSIHRSSLGNVTTGLVVLKGNFILGTDWINATDDGTQWNRYWATLQIASSDITYLQWRIENSVANKTLYICGMKLEKGDKPTPWCPNSADELATTIGLNDNVEYDTSGYGNNGEYYAYDTNGSISYTSDTPKYNVSTHIASANPTQNAASGTRYLYGHCELTNPTQMSVAFWLKPITGGYGSTTSNGQGYFCTTNYEYGNTSVGSDYQASAMNHRDGTVNMNDSTSTTQCNVTFYPTIGEWHHYVYTYDGQVGRGYKDGVQTATAQFSAAKTLDSFIGVVIGFSKAGRVWRRNDACYSDFRIYTTALSAEDVKDLYELGAAIDTNNILYTYELNEV